MENVFFMAYAGIIPLVPLMGYQHFKAKKQSAKKRVCFWLFLGQIALSGVLIYFKVFRG